MRLCGLVCTLGIFVGCGNDSGIEPDARPGPAAPRVIAGGGIGDGPIDGVVNLYAIDEVTRMPVKNATVRVGTVDGTTDDTGLFIAEGVTGPQTVTVVANGYRRDVWVGVNGANVTIDLSAANVATPAKATLTGTINFPALAAGHTHVAVAGYSQVDALGDAANNLAQPSNMNVCFGDTSCTFTLVSRTGSVGVIAAIFDRDLMGTPDPNDDTQTLIGWAVKTGVTVQANVAQSLTLDLIPANMLQTVTVSFGSPPSGLGTVGSIVGIETADGVLQLSPAFQTPTATTVLAPKPEAIASGATYRLTGVANDGNATNLSQSIVLRRGQTGAQLSAGEWLAPPAGSATITGGSWTAVTAATVHSLEYTQGGTNLLNISVFDGSTTVTIPDLVTLPSPPLTAAITAIGAPGLDVTSFSLDDDRDKLVMIGGQTLTVNN